MKTQLEQAREGILTPQIQRVAEKEGLHPDLVRRRVAKGEIVIPCNPNRPGQQVVGIGRGLRTKVNASIGTSSDICDLKAEVAKAVAAQEEGADTLMELSAGGNLDRVRREVLNAVDLPVGNVPLYQAFKETARKYRDPARLDPEFLFDLIEKQLEDGISFMAIHCGINQYTIRRARRRAGHPSGGAGGRHRQVPRTPREREAGRHGPPRHALGRPGQLPPLPRTGPPDSR
jgi:5-hydroxybenzimidazole synthase